jgi:Spy/CpxP family protein refolding chaperone
MCHTSWARCAPRSEFQGYRQHGQRHGPGPEGWGDDPMGRGFGEEGGFGVRRPLRFLAYKLGLDDRQVAELARVLDELKTERAQAAVDDRRSLAEFADALAGEAFDAARAATAGERRVEAARRLREKLVASLQQIHAMLNPDQRARLAYLIRTGVLAV